MSMRFTDDETVQFVNLYADQQCLWNLNIPQYRNKQLRLAAEREIIGKFGKRGFGLSQLKQKIKILRCTYNQECLKIKTSKKFGANTPDVYVPKLKWFQTFDRIMKIAKAEIKTECSMVINASKETNSLQEEQEDENGAVYDALPLELQNDNTVPKTHTSEALPRTKRSKISNLTKDADLRDDIQDNTNNEHEAFGHFVAATLNNLRTRNALMAQHEIQGILLKYRLADVT